MSLAARGARDLDEGEERVADRGERWRAQRQALGVVARGVLIGAGLTAGVVLI